MKPIGIGMIGLGRAGWDIHIAGLRELSSHFRVAAVTDPLEERRRQADQELGCRTYDDAEGVLLDDSVELVVIATPTHTHVPLAMAALAAGKHVLIEKPMATSSADVARLEGAAITAGRLVTSFQNNRLDPSFRVIRQLVQEGRLGEIVLIRRAHHRYHRRSDWQTLRRLGGGELSNIASHYLDQMLWMYEGAELDIHADLRHTISAGDAEDHCKISLSVANGPLVEIEASATVALPQPAWFVVGTRGTVTGTTRSLHVRWLDGAVPPVPEPSEGAAAGRRYLSSDPLPWAEEEIEVPPDRRTQEYYLQLHEAITNGADPMVSPASIRRLLDLIDLAREDADFA